MDGPVDRVGLSLVSWWRVGVVWPPPEEAPKRCGDNRRGGRVGALVRVRIGMGPFWKGTMWLG